MIPQNDNTEEEINFSSLHQQDLNDYSKSNKNISAKEAQKTSFIPEEKNHSLLHLNFAFDNEFQRIDEIVNTFLSDEGLKRYSKDEILKVLNDNSFDIRNSYLQLKGKNFKNYAFTKNQDYIIKFMQNSELYNELCKLKGKLNVQRREKYLSNEG